MDAEIIQIIPFYIQSMRISIQDKYTDISQVYLYIEIKDQPQFIVFRMSDFISMDWTFNSFTPKDFIFLSNT